MSSLGESHRCLVASGPPRATAASRHAGGRAAIVRLPDPVAQLDHLRTRRSSKGTRTSSPFLVPQNAVGRARPVGLLEEDAGRDDLYPMGSGELLPWGRSGASARPGKAFRPGVAVPHRGGRRNGTARSIGWAIQSGNPSRAPVPLDVASAGPPSPSQHPRSRR